MRIKDLYDIIDLILCGLATLVFVPFIIWAFAENDTDDFYALIGCYVAVLAIILLVPVASAKYFGR